MAETTLHTRRLTLRRWKASDIDPFAQMNADPEVMRYFPALLSAEESAGMVAKIESSFDTHGLGLWAIEITGTKTFIGFAGLSRPRFEAPFTPCVEVGWRLAKEHWGNGYAPEAAEEALRDGFERLELTEIVSFTATINLKSIRVMQKLGMFNDRSEDFLHPLVGESSPLKPHVLYRLTRDAWRVRPESPR